MITDTCKCGATFKTDAACGDMKYQKPGWDLEAHKAWLESHAQALPSDVQGGGVKRGSNGWVDWFGGPCADMPETSLAEELALAVGVCVAFFVGWAALEVAIWLLG